MSTLVMTTAVPVRVHYLGLPLSPALREALQAQAARLETHAAKVESCALHVGNWHLHRDEGHLYRVALEIELKGGGKLVSKRESPRNARSDVLPKALQDAFDESLSRLARKG